MKKLYTFILLLLATITTQAQLNGTGYYRFRNNQYATEYIRLSNNLFDYDEIIAKACGGGSNLVNTNDLWGLISGNVSFKEDGVARCLSCARAFLSTDIHMIEDASIVDPATIVYASKRYQGNSSNMEYNLIGQSISMTALTTGKYETEKVTIEFSNLYVTIEGVSGNSSLYTAKIPLTGKVTKVAGMNVNMTKTLSNMYFVDDNGTFNVNESNASSNAQWYIEPVTYFNVQPEVDFGGKHYTTLYVPFAFQLSEEGQVEKAYVMTGINDDGSLVITKIASKGETVPAGTPVILECSSKDAASCKLLIPNTEPRVDNNTSYTGTNLLQGAYLSNLDGNMYYDTTAGTGKGFFNANNFATTTNPQKYVLGITASGTLGFVKATGTAMPANKAWLEYTGTAELVLPFFIRGDVTCDGKVDVADVTALVNIVLGKDNKQPYQYDHKAAELDGKEGINITDVTTLVNMILSSN